jgi:MFS transporter, FSR family, fosmidomycin resistance protein
MVAAAGALVNAGLPLMVVAAQDLAPHAMGAASGLLMGFTWGTAGLLYVGIGALQELAGIGPRCWCRSWRWCRRPTWRGA